MEGTRIAFPGSDSKREMSKSNKWKWKNGPFGLRRSQNLREVGPKTAKMILNSFNVLNFWGTKQRKRETPRDLTDPRLQILTFWKNPDISEGSSGRLSGWEIRKTSSQVKEVPAADTERVVDLDLKQAWVRKRDGNCVEVLMGKAGEALEMQREGTNEFWILYERGRVQLPAISELGQLACNDKWGHSLHVLISSVPAGEHSRSVPDFHHPTWPVWMV